MPRLTKLIVAILAAQAFFAGTAHAASRIKDIVNVEHVRENQLIGYGLVVGLNGTGDRIRNTPFTEQALAAMLERLGLNIRDQRTLRTENVAAVTVTANLPPFSRRGSRIDVQIAAMGDATSLQGGTLLVTPLVGLDGEVYSVAQGAVAVSGFNARGQAESVQRGVATSARISSGAIVEREVPFDLASQTSLKLALKNPDFTTAQRISAVINQTQPGAAITLDPATVELRLPQGYAGGMIGLVSTVERLTVTVDQPARVVIDEATGTVVMGSDVRISKAAIAQGPLTIRISEAPQVSQPSPFARVGETAVVPRTIIDIDDSSDHRLGLAGGGASLQDLVDGLNALRVSPRDLIAILQSLKAAGALQAEIEVF